MRSRLDGPAIRDVFPPVCRDMLGPSFDLAAPREARADCRHCAMWGDDEARGFSRETKCCTFDTALPQPGNRRAPGDVSGAGLERPVRGAQQSEERSIHGHPWE